MENRIKEQQLALFADRTSTGTMAGNQMRLYFSSFAYVLLCAMRRLALAGTRHAKAQCGHHPSPLPQDRHPPPGHTPTNLARPALALRAFALSVTACPGCGRTTSTTFQELALQVEDFIEANLPEWRSRYEGVEELKLAVMGCVVNGPGESKAAGHRHLAFRQRRGADVPGLRRRTPVHDASRHRGGTVGTVHPDRWGVCGESVPPSGVTMGSATTLSCAASFALALPCPSADARRPGPEEVPRIEARHLFSAPFSRSRWINSKGDCHPKSHSTSIDVA